MQPQFIHPRGSCFLSSMMILAALTGLAPADPYLSQDTLPRTRQRIPPVDVSPMLSRGTDDFLSPAGSVAVATAKHNVCLLLTVRCCWLQFCSGKTPKSFQKSCHLTTYLFCNLSSWLLLSKCNTLHWFHSIVFLLFLQFSKIILKPACWYPRSPSHLCDTKSLHELKICHLVFSTRLTKLL